MSLLSYAWQSSQTDFKLSYSFLAEVELWTLVSIKNSLCATAPIHPHGYQVNCQPYVDSWLTSLLALARYAPQLLTFTLYITGLWHKELYLLLFGIGMSLSTLLNWAFNSLTGDAVPPRVATCIPVHGAVLSFESQQIAFFITFAMGYVVLYEAGARVWHMLLLVSIFALVFLGDHMLNYHTAEAIVAAATLGSVLAFCYQWLLYILVVPSFPYVLQSRYVRYFGYDDTLCYSVSLSSLGRYVLRGFDERFPAGDQIVDPAAVCELVRERVHDYLTNEHAVFLARDIAHIQPLLVCRIESETTPLYASRARQFIETHF